VDNQVKTQTLADGAKVVANEHGVRVESALDLLSDHNEQQILEPAPEVEIESKEDRDGFTAEERRMYPNLSDYASMWEARNARRDREAKARRRRAWVGSDAGRSLKRLGQAFLEYKACLEKNPKTAAAASEFDEANQRLFDLIGDRMRSHIEKAQNAPRCARIMAGGRRCRAPRVRGQKYCHMHQAMDETRPQKISLPSLDDANGIQLAIAKSAQALVDGTLDQKQASLLACYLRLAASNVDRLDFESVDFENKERER
jgi:hypothetical protein